MSILITGLFAPSGGPGSFDLYDPADIQAGDINVALQAIAGGKFIGGSHATAPVGEVVIQRKTTTGAPTHSATEGTLCWNTVDDTLYCNNNGTTGWTLIGAGSHALTDVNNTISGRVAGDLLIVTGSTTFGFAAMSGDATINGSGVLTVAATHAGSTHHDRSHDHSNASDGTTLTPAILNIPAAASPAQTADGQVVWDSDDNLLTVGDGAARKTFYPVDDAVSDPTNVSATAGADGTEATVARKDHRHVHASIASGDLHPEYATDADLNTHAGAVDPHTGYRLESADHSHVSTGLQGGVIYSRHTYVFVPDAAQGATITAGDGQGIYHHSGPNAMTADALEVDAETAPGASGLPITIAYGDTNDLDTVASWTTIATLTLSSAKSDRTTSMTNATIPANRLLRLSVGTIVGTPKDAGIHLHVKRPLVT